MAYFLRLIILLLLPVSALAAFSPGTVWNVNDSSGQPVGTGSYNSVEAGCNAWYQDLIANAPSNYVWNGLEIRDISGNNRSKRCYATNRQGGSWSTVITMGTSCPSNSDTLVDGNCECKAGYQENNGVCVPERDICASDFHFAGWGVGSGFGQIRDTKKINGIVPSGPICWPYGDEPGKGCTVEFTRTSIQENDNGTFSSIGTFSYPSMAGGGSQRCDVPWELEEDDGTEVKEECKNKGSISIGGQTSNVCLDQAECENGYLGEVNGVDVCVPNSESKETEEKEETDEDGVKTKTEKETKCVNGKCTTTEKKTTTTPGGQATSGTKTTEQDQSSFCKQNPSSSLCKNAMFGGNCAGGFRCDGDAVQCALAQEVHKRNCQFWDGVNEQNPNVNLFNEALAKKGKIVDDLPGNVDLDISTLLSANDQFGLSGGSCPSPMSIALPQFMGGANIDISFDDICPILEMMGNLIVILATISGAFIIFRRYG